MKAGGREKARAVVRAAAGIAVEVLLTALLMAVVFLAGWAILHWFRT